MNFVKRFFSFFSNFRRPLYQFQQTLEAVTVPTNEYADANLFELAPVLRHYARVLPRIAAIRAGLVADLIGRGIWFAAPSLSSEERARVYDVLSRIGPQGEPLEELQAATISELLFTGNVFFVLLTENDKITLLPRRLEDLHLEQRFSIPDTTFYFGVYLDKLGRPKAYDFSQFARPVPASDVIHYYIPGHLGAVFGVPLLAPVLHLLQRLEELEQAELRRVKAASGLYGVLKTPDADLLSAPNARVVRPGGLLVLSPGEEFSAVTFPTSNLDPQRHLADAMLQQVAAAVGLSLFWLDRNPARANYSSLREEHVRNQRYLTTIQKAYGQVLFAKLFAFFVRHRVLSSVPEFSVLPDRHAYVDPEKEVSADVKSLEANLSTLTDLLAARGTDLEDFLKQKRDEIQKIAELKAFEQKLYEQLGLPTGPTGEARSAPNVHVPVSVSIPPIETRERENIKSYTIKRTSEGFRINTTTGGSE